MTDHQYKKATENFGSRQQMTRAKMIMKLETLTQAHKIKLNRESQEKVVEMKHEIDLAIQNLEEVKDQLSAIKITKKHFSNFVDLTYKNVYFK